jgi:DNA-binding response OmpR family regulator
MTPISSATKTSEGIVALFNASDDTVDMVQKLLTDAGNAQTLIWCHFADLKKGIVDFSKFTEKHNPEIVIFDVSPPYDENWQFFKKMRDSKVMRDRGLILTTTNKARLDEVLGEDSYALEVVGRPKDLTEIDAAIKTASRKAQGIRMATA